jgi:hypothetical protein
MSRLSESIKKIADKDPQDSPAEVRTPMYQGVSVDHPSIVSAIKNMTKDGQRVEEIARVVGMPIEVVRKHQGT